MLQLFLFITLRTFVVILCIVHPVIPIRYIT